MVLNFKDDDCLPERAEGAGEWRRASSGQASLKQESYV